MNGTEILQWLNTAALAVIAYLLAQGYLVPMSVVKPYMIAPLQDRIEALERVSARREEQNTDLQRTQAAALEAQSKALEMIHQSSHRGGD